MTTYFDWDTVEDNIVEEFDDAGSTIADYTTEPYLYGDLVSQRRSGQSRFYHFDGLGSTTELTDNMGAVTDTRQYSAFGVSTEQGGSDEITFSFGGRRQYYADSAFQLSVRRRSYNTTRGHWLSVDPFPGQSIGHSPFVYSGNNPVRFTDPSGLWAVDPKTSAAMKANCDCSTLTRPRTVLSTLEIKALIVCAAGEPTIMFNQEVPDYDEQLRKESDCDYLKCTRSHESHHIEQVADLCPDICKDKKCDDKSFILVRLTDKAGVKAGTCTSVRECPAEVIGLNCYIDVYLEHRKRDNKKCVELGELLLITSIVNITNYKCVPDKRHVPKIDILSEIYEKYKDIILRQTTGPK